MSRRFRLGDNVVDALVEVSARINSGEVTVIAGPSGSGKTTLLTILAGHETKDSGAIAVHPPTAGGRADRTPQLGVRRLRAADSGTPRRADRRREHRAAGAAGQRKFRRRDRNSTGGWATSELMGRLQIDHLADRYPSQTSGGEQQRTAIARALRLLPPLIIADEPTGHQDRARVRIVLDTMKEYARTGRAVVIASHDDDVLAAADTLIRMQDGRLHTEWARA